MNETEKLKARLRHVKFWCHRTLYLWAESSRKRWEAGPETILFADAAQTELKLGGERVGLVSAEDAIFIAHVSAESVKLATSVLFVIVDLEPLLDADEVFAKTARRVLLGICRDMNTPDGLVELGFEPEEIEAAGGWMIPPRRIGITIGNMEAIERVNFE